MARFSYRAKFNPEEVVEGEIEAASEEDAISRLSNTGYFPFSIQADDLRLSWGKALHLPRVSHKEILVFTRQLANLSESGVNIIKSMNIISTQLGNRNLKKVLLDVAGKIKDGRSLSESLGAYPEIFSNLYISMVRAGEAGGRIEKSLKNLADFLERDEDFRGSIRQAMAYPVFVLAVSLLTVAVLLTFVIPRLVTMFEDMGQALPLPTRILINISLFMRNYWWLILAAIAGFVFLLKRMQNKPKGKVILDSFMLKVPVLGGVTLKQEISRLMNTLSLLLSSGLALLESLDICESVLENQALKNQLQAFKKSIASGLSLSKCLAESGLFPAYAVSIVVVGEETGTLERSLERIGIDYQKEADAFLKTFSRLLEPVIILAMGLIVGFIVLSMLLPIFQINLMMR